MKELDSDRLGLKNLKGFFYYSCSTPSKKKASEGRSEILVSPMNGQIPVTFATK
jgi:hypothetical protein